MEILATLASARRTAGLDSGSCDHERVLATRRSPARLGSRNRRR